MKRDLQPPMRKLRYWIEDQPEERAVQATLTQDLARVLTAQFPVLGQGCHDSKGVAIRFAAEEELEQESQCLPPSEHDLGGFDLLGVYVPGPMVSDKCGGEARILVSSAKIMRKARELQKKAALSMSVDEVHRILLLGVVIHELAHAMMDGQTGPLAAEHDAWADVYTHKYGFVFEESLAEACVLVQDFSTVERDLLSSFIESGPRAYRAGLRWLTDEPANAPKLMATMRAWRDHKALDSVLLFKLFTPVPSLQRRSQAKLQLLPALANRLLLGESPGLPFDFRAAFAEDVEQARAKGLSHTEEQLANQHLDYRYKASPKKGGPSPRCQSGACAAENRTLQDPVAIRAWLEEVGIQDFELDGDIVNVDGDIDLSGRELGCIPVKFGRINGHFDCSGNGLRSLCGLPDVVIGNVYCCHNHICSLAGLGNGGRIIAGYLCLDGNEPLRNAIWAVGVNGLQAVVAPVKGLHIVNRYLGRPEDIYECQAELSDKGFDALAEPGADCGC